MRIGVPKEVKVHEYRAGLTPAGARELAARGHEVVVQSGLGAAIGLADEQYRSAGAQVVGTAAEVFSGAGLIVKVKEPQPGEIALLRPDQMLFTYLHLAADAAQAQGLAASGAVAIAYETVTGPAGALPLLAPMSEVAGRMAVNVGASLLQLPAGGSGILPGGVPGVAPAHVVILGAGSAGSHAAQMAIGLGARVTVLNRGLERLRELDARHGNRITTFAATGEAVRREAADADLLIGAVLVPGASAPRLVDRATVARMRPGSVIVDIAIDQGGCCETSRPTTHTAPTYIDEGVLHYCVTNMPGAVARTSTFALTNATLPFVLALADKGWRTAMRSDAHLLAGLNVCRGEITCRPVAESLRLRWRDARELLL